jgi:hypothetical protein
MGRRPANGPPRLGQEAIFVKLIFLESAVVGILLFGVRRLELQRTRNSREGLRIPRERERESRSYKTLVHIFYGNSDRLIVPSPAITVAA